MAVKKKAKEAEKKPLLTLIEEAGALEMAIEDAKEGYKDKLREIKATYGDTIDHPDKGLVTIMVRGDAVFWRPKPRGPHAYKDAAE